MWSYCEQIRNWVTVTVKMPVSVTMFGNVFLIRKTLPNNETGFVTLTITGFIISLRNRRAS